MIFGDKKRIIGESDIRIFEECVMPEVISIPLQEKFTTRKRSGAANEVQSSTELRTRPFLVGPENYVICSAVYDILKDIPNPFSILFSAPSGYGKTHLAEGLLVTWLSQHPQASGKCVTAQEFARDWANAQRTRTTHEFLPRYNQLDFFVIENLQEIVTYESTQEQLVQMLDRLNKRGTRILTTSNQPLSILPLQPKLMSRLRQGVCIEIQEPSAEVRRAILQLPEHSKNIIITEDGLESIVQISVSEKDSPAMMIQRMKRMEFVRKTNQEGTITAVMTQQEFEPGIEENTITIAQIAKLAAKFYKVKLVDLKSKSRKTTLVIVRDIIYYLSRKITGATLEEIGAFFNGRDHTTILHGVNQAEKMVQNDEEVRRCIDYLCTELHVKKF